MGGREVRWAEGLQAELSEDWKGQGRSVHTTSIFLFLATKWLHSQAFLTGLKVPTHRQPSLLKEQRVLGHRQKGSKKAS